MIQTGVGAVLQQKSEDGTCPVAYIPRTLRAAEPAELHSTRARACCCYLCYARLASLLAWNLHIRRCENRPQTSAKFTDPTAIVAKTCTMGAVPPRVRIRMGLCFGNLYLCR
jgi:hypothetical protein